MLAGDRYAGSVREELAARALGITGVPFTVLGGVYAVSGAQSVAVYTGRSARPRPPTRLRRARTA